MTYKTMTSEQQRVHDVLGELFSAYDTFATRYDNLAAQVLTAQDNVLNSDDLRDLKHELTKAINDLLNVSRETGHPESFSIDLQEALAEVKEA